MSDRNGGGPNILVLMTDEHAAQFAGTYGHPFIATPGMDRLACEGVTFDAAYCNNPLCVPSRLSFMTGRYTHRCGGWDNSTALAVDAVTWPYLLRAQGYEAVLSGKMQHPTQIKIGEWATLIQQADKVLRMLQTQGFVIRRLTDDAEQRHDAHGAAKQDDPGPGSAAGN